MTTKSDETGERLAYTGILGTGAQQTSSVWQVLICRFVFVFGSATGSYTFEFVCPPIPVLNTDAESLWYALERHPSVQTVQALKKALLRNATVAMDINEFDAASSNLRLHAHKSDACEPHVLAEQMLCHNHQNKIVEILMLRAIGYNLLMSLYSLSLFLRMGGYFVRLVAAVREVVRSASEVRPWPPPERERVEATAFAEEFKDMLVQNYTPSDTRHARRHRRPRPGERDRASEDILDTDSEPGAAQGDGAAAGAHSRRRRDRKAGFRKALNEFFDVFNGLVSQGRLVHYCRGRQCCANLADSQNKMVLAILGLTLRRIPGTPSATKWTKLGPCLDAMLVGQLHNLWPKLFSTAFARMTFVTDVKSDVNPADVDPEVQSELTWHQVAGVRYQKANRLVRDEADNENLRIAAVTMEPIRFLTRWFLRCSREHHAPKIPYLCSATDPQFSPVTTAAQHFTAMLFGSASRLRVIFGMRGCQSFLEWARLYPESAATLRRAILVGISGIRKRHAKPLESWPWRLTSLCDPRVSDGDKRSIASQFVATKACCLPFGFARRLQSRIGGIHDLLSQDFQAAMWGLARAVQMTVAGIENRHARSRRRRTPDTAWHNFVVRYVNEEAKTLQVMREIRQSRERAQLQLLDGSCESATHSSTGPLSTIAPVLRFRAVFLLARLFSDRGFTAPLCPGGPYSPALTLRLVGLGIGGELVAIALACRSFSGACAEASSAMVLAGQAQPAAAGHDGGDDNDGSDRKVVRSAFKIFRDQIITRDRELGRRPRIASTEHWDSVKAAWRALDPERKRAYEDQASSEQDRVMARRKRRQLAARSVRQAASQVGLARLQDGVAASSPPEQQPEPQPPQGGLRSTVYVNKALETSHAHSELTLPAMQSLRSSTLEVSRHPLPERLFAEYLKRTHGQRVQGCENFKEKCQKMQGGSDFPKKVRYHSHCGAVCSQTAGEDKVNFHSKIKVSIASYVSKNFKVAGDVAVSDVLFAIEVFGRALADGSEAMSVTFAAMTVASGRRAHLEAEQTFVPCHVVAGAGAAPYEGFTLEYLTDRVEAKGKLPTKRVQEDRVLRQCDGDELAAVLLANEGLSDIDRLVWRRLAWNPPEDGGLHRLRVIGAHASEPLTIEKGTGTKQAGKSKVDGDGDIDFLEMLAWTGPRPRRAPASRANKPDGRADDDGAAANLLGRDLQPLLDEAGLA